MVVIAVVARSWGAKSSPARLGSGLLMAAWGSMGTSVNLKKCEISLKSNILRKKSRENLCGVGKGEIQRKKPSCLLPKTDIARRNQ